MIKITLEIDENFLLENCNPIIVNNLLKEGKIDKKILLPYLSTPMFLSDFDIKEFTLYSKDMLDENSKELFTKAVVFCTGLFASKELKKKTMYKVVRSGEVWSEYEDYEEAINVAKDRVDKITGGD